MLNILINKISKKFRGKSIENLEGVSEFDAFIFLVNKGLFPWIRGLIQKIFVGSVDGNIFIGRFVKLYCPKKLHIGKNLYIGDFSIINCYSKDGIHIGDNVTIREFAWIQLTSSVSNPGESIHIGSGTYIGPRVTLGAGSRVSIGSNCQIGANVNFVGENHLFDGSKEIHFQGVSRQGISIGDDCWFGNNVTILDGVKIGSGVVIGAGSVVTKSFPNNAVIVGVPAKILRMRN